MIVGRLFDGEEYAALSDAEPEFDDELTNGEAMEANAALDAAIRRSIARDEGEKQTGVAMYRRVRNLCAMTAYWAKARRRTR